MALALTAAPSMPSTSSCPTAEHLSFRCVLPASYYTHPFIHSNPHASILPLIHSIIIHHSLTDSLTHSLTHSLTCSFVHPSNQPFIHSYIRSFSLAFTL